ncbi:MAG: hypothetical protein ACRD5I_08915 [Candidatus Acidiferrales bacterium]
MPTLDSRVHFGETGQRERTNEMTERVRKNLVRLKASIKRHTPGVKRQLSRSGMAAKPAVVLSAAKYYSALKKLAQQ